jgi:hypothetical protein
MARSCPEATSSLFEIFFCFFFVSVSPSLTASSTWLIVSTCWSWFVGGMHLAAWEDGLSDASGRIFRVVNRGGGLFLQFSLVVA